MKRLLSLLVLAIITVQSIAQVVQVSPTKRLLIPKATDTVYANVAGNKMKVAYNIIQLMGGGEAANQLAFRNSANTKWTILDVSGGGGGGGSWGSITGTLSAQIDLQTALNLKASLAGSETFTGAKAFSAAINLTAAGTSAPQMRLGTLEVQSFTLGNTWFGDNIYYNGTSHIYRATGPASQFYFYNQGGTIAEDQFRLYGSNTGGTAVALGTSAKVKFNSGGDFAVGNMSETPGSFTGATFTVAGTGNVGIGVAPGTEKLKINGTLSINDILYHYSNTSMYMKFYNAGTPYISFTARNNTADFAVSQVGNVGMGTNTPVASAKVEIVSTTQGLLVPRMTTTQRNAIVSPADGLLITNTTTKRLNEYNSGNWNGHAETLVATVTAINGLTGSTNLFTVPASNKFVVTKVILRVITSTSVSANSEYNLQWGSGTTFNLRAYTTTILQTNDILFIGPGTSGAEAGIGIVGQAGEVLKLNIPTAGTGTTLTLEADVFGYYVQ